MISKIFVISVFSILANDKPLRKVLRRQNVCILNSILSNHITKYTTENPPKGFWGFGVLGFWGVGCRV